MDYLLKLLNFVLKIINIFGKLLKNIYNVL